MAASFRHVIILIVSRPVIKPVYTCAPIWRIPVFDHVLKTLYTVAQLKSKMGCNNSKRNDGNYRKTDEILEMMLTIVKITINQESLAEGQSRNAENFNHSEDQIAIDSVNSPAQQRGNASTLHYFYIINSGSREVSFSNLLPSMGQTVVSTFVNRSYQQIGFMRRGVSLKISYHSYFRMITVALPSELPAILSPLK